MGRLYLSIVGFFLVCGICQAVNNRPIIGIVALPTEPAETQYGKYYMAASYVKFVESGGGRVVPIMYDASQAELDSLFSQLNGILFTGGDADISVHAKLWNTAQYILNLAMAANDKGDYFPILGHCLGFELLNMVVSANDSILDPFDSENLTLPLRFYDDYRQSRLFGNTDQTIINTLSGQAVTMNNHRFGVSPSTYASNSKLSSFFRMISWDMDRGNKPFISTVEGFKYPVYALQWHPEKVAFEWNPREGINHSADSVRANEYITQFFLSEARKSTHTFSSPSAEYKALIYNYEPVYSSSIDPDFTQMYFFP
jgi:gamma-glutamyl hydrolase